MRADSCGARWGLGVSLLRVFLLVVVAALFVFRLTAYVDAQGAIEPLVGGGEDHAEESVASAQVVDVIEELLGERVGRGAHREREKRLV